MYTEKQAGRLVGTLLLVAMGVGIWSNFGLTDPVFGGAGFLANGADQGLRFGLGALLGLVTSALGLAAAIIAWPILRRSSESLALGFLSLVAIGFATGAAEQATFLSLQSLSKQYAANVGADGALFEILRGMASASRNWIHYIDKIIGGGALLLLHLALYRSRLVPRALSAFGTIAALTQMAGITLELFSRDLPMIMLAPLGLAQLLLCLVLLARGFVVPAPVRAPAGRA